MSGKNKYTIQEIPSEVQEALFISQMNYVGSALMNKYLNTVKKYPNWFPKEYIWHYVITDEIHQKYRDEVKKLYSDIFDSIPNNGKGLTWYADNLPDFFENMRQNEIRKPEYEARKKIIFDKYFKSFGITYKEFGNY